MSAKRPLNAMFRLWGETVIVKPRTESVDENTGAPTFTFPTHTWFEARSLIYDASGLREEWYIIGKQAEVDYLASFSTQYQDLINPMDRVELQDGTLTVVDTVIERGRGPNKDFLEVLLRKVS